MVVARESHSSSTTLTSRLKREHCNRTKHDSNFSHWKILIGPSDWENYSNGKEGSTRYRIQNLPEKSSPAVYELGIAVSTSSLGRDIYKLAPDRIVVVYLGRTKNVRKRLQHYGRSGSHLGYNCSDYVISASLQKGRPLFEEVFQQGYPIVYRWAPMKTKEDAIRTEAQLLSTFDYAWNTSSNGNQRPDDILQKLNKTASGSKTLSDLVKELLPITQKRAGIQIKSSKLPLRDNKSDEEDNGSYSFLSRVFNFNRSRPRKVQEITGAIQENAKICGVALSDGSVCTSSPAEGRKRCPEHKGMRTNVSTSKAKREPKLESIVVLESDVYCKTEGIGYIDENVGPDVEDSRKVAAGSPVDEGVSNTNICGIILNDGSTCRRQPVKGRKRCQEHKGKRISSPVHVNQWQYPNSA